MLLKSMAVIFLMDNIKPNVIRFLLIEYLFFNLNFLSKKNIKSLSKIDFGYEIG